MVRAPRKNLKIEPLQNWRDEAVHFSRGFFRAFFALERKVLAVVLSFIVIISYAQAFIAFEAHVINVEATLVQIDPPVISPNGGEYGGTVAVTIDDSDSEATHIFYTLTPGLNPDVAPNPGCDDVLGGLKPIGPFDITSDTVVKAVACDGPDWNAHQSVVTTEIFDISNPYGAIDGFKYNDVDQSGTLTDGDFQLEGWTITLYDGDGFFVAETATDANGHYRFDTLSPGSYSVEEESRAGWQQTSPGSGAVTVNANDDLIINFFNYDTGYSCVPKDVNFTANLAVQAAGGTSGNDDIGIASNVTINGDVRSNDEIEVIGGGANRTINGNATVVNTIDAGIVVTGTTTTGAASALLPDVMISEWQNRARDGGTVNGSFTFPNGTVGLVLGPSEITGDLTFGSSNAATLKGTLYVHGNLGVGSNTGLTQDAAFGDQFVTIVVDGTIDIDSNVSFLGAGSSGTFLLISTHAAVDSDDAAIETSSNNSDLGDVVLYASNGDIHIRSNRTLLAAFAAAGTGYDGDDNAAVRLDSNVTVNYRALPNKISCGPRQPYETTSHVLINEFMPNPSGSDQGTAGLPLDGEWVELFNPTASDVDVNGWVLYDEINTHALVISSANTDTGGTTAPSLGFLVVYRDGDADFALDNSGGDTVRLFSAPIGSGGVLIDSHTYTRGAPDNKSFSRVPDGAANWVDPDATPGEENIMPFVEPSAGPGLELFEPPVLPPLVVRSADDWLARRARRQALAEARKQARLAAAAAEAAAIAAAEQAAEDMASSGDDLEGRVGGVFTEDTSDVTGEGEANVPEDESGQAEVLPEIITPDDSAPLDQPPADAPSSGDNEAVSPPKEPAPVDEPAPTETVPDAPTPAEEPVPAAEPPPAETTPS